MHTANSSSRAEILRPDETTAPPDRLDLLWSAGAIGEFIGRTPRQTWEALNKGELPARQINGRWCASKRRLTAFFEGEDAA